MYSSDHRARKVANSARSFSYFISFLKSFKAFVVNAFKIKKNLWNMMPGNLIILNFVIIYLNI